MRWTLWPSTKKSTCFCAASCPLIGYPYAIVKYERAERFAGESKYPLKKMLALAFDGITSFSVKPIKMVTALGVTITILSVLALLYCLVAAFIPAIGVPGLVLVGCIFLSCGLIISSLGLIGSYIGKIYGEVKARPRFFVEDLLLK